jgi:hypothetical protein
MVWSQYVYEATVGCDTDGSEDDTEIESESHLNIHDWGVEYSDELWYLWDMIKIYLYDAMLENTLFTECVFTDFEEFCYIQEHDTPEYIDCRYKEHLFYIWLKIIQYIEDNSLHNDILCGTSFEDFVNFVMIHTKQNNIDLY